MLNKPVFQNPTMRKISTLTSTTHHGHMIVYIIPILISCLVAIWQQQVFICTLTLPSICRFRKLFDSSSMSMFCMPSYASREYPQLLIVVVSGCRYGSCCVSYPFEVRVVEPVRRRFGHERTVGVPLAGKYHRFFGLQEVLKRQQITNKKRIMK